MVDRKRKVAKPTKKIQRGAVKTPRVTKEKGFPLIRSLAVVCLLGVASWGVTKIEWQAGWQKAKAVVSKPISNVEVRGDFKFIDKTVIEQLLQAHKENNFVNLKLSQIKKEVQEVPWVEAVTINRVWPNSIVLNVKEQKAIARWGDEGFINQYGEIVKTNQIQELGKLPVLHGREELSREITETYIEVAELFSESGVVLRGLSMDDKRSWRLELNKDIELVLGRENVIQKLRNFLYVYELKLKQQENEIEKIDLRYQSGLAVKWKEARDEIANANTNKLLLKVN